MKIKYAYVSGQKPHYVLHVANVIESKEFSILSGIEFGSYRAAQDIANAINENVNARNAEVYGK